MRFVHLLSSIFLSVIVANAIPAPQTNVEVTVGETSEPIVPVSVDDGSNDEQPAPEAEDDSSNYGDDVTDTDEDIEAALNASDAEVEAEFPYVPVTPVPAADWRSVLASYADNTTAVEARDIEARAVITTMSAAGIDNYKDFINFASTAYCKPAKTLTWKCGGKFCFTTAFSLETSDDLFLSELQQEPQVQAGRRWGERRFAAIL